MYFAFVLAIGGLFVALVDAQGNSQIVSDIIKYPEVMRMGTTAKLRCIVANKGINNVQWYFTTYNLMISRDKELVLDNNNNGNGVKKYDINAYKDGDLDVFELHVYELEIRDNGVYTCLIYVSGGDNERKSTDLVVMVPPMIDPSRTQSVVNAPLNSTATLRCYADGVPTPTILWQRLTGERFRDGTQRKTGPVLVIPNVSRADRGLYRCAARNNLDPSDPIGDMINDGKSSSSSAVYNINLNVQFPPMGKAIQSTYGQAANKQFDLQLVTRLSGNPLPNVHWFIVEPRNKEGGAAQNRRGIGEDPILSRNKTCDEQWVVVDSILDDPDFRQNADENCMGCAANTQQYILTIINVRAYHFATYLVVGENQLGAYCVPIEVYETTNCQGVCSNGQSGAVNDRGSAHAVLLSYWLLILATIL